MRKIYFLIAGSALAMLLLIGFQLHWIKNSKLLIEEQFTNRVSMALCTAVEKMSTEPGCCTSSASGDGSDTPSCTNQVRKMMKDSAFDRVLRSSLAFYQIDLPYEVNITTKDTSLSEIPPYSCSLTPLLAEDDHWLQLIFQGKQDYFNLKMQYMSGASVLILFSICALFVFAAYYLIKQQKISEENRQFFNHMTHEFSTPLTNIQLATKMMQRKSENNNHKPYLDIIETQSNQLRYQVENVLHLATMEKENLKINKDLLDLNELAREAVDSMQLQIEEKQASVHIHPAQQPCQIRGDKFHLRNVFRNLIDNALKYCSHTPKVEIGFYPMDEGWCAQVKDNGIGIPSEERDKIFNRFYRSPSSQETTTRGFGIGLAYVKRIIDLHQGDIRLGTALSSGTCFELYFPNTK